MTDKKIITDFEVVDHGIEHEQYFQGCGTSLTDFEYCQTGCGDNPAEAIDDCLEQIACCGEAEVDGMEERILKDIKRRKMPKRPKVKASQDECHYYVSIRYNTGYDLPDILDDDLTLDHHPDIRECRQLLAKFRADGFCPNVWHINERGNTDLLSIGHNGSKIVKSWV